MRITLISLLITLSAGISIFFKVSPELETVFNLPMFLCIVLGSTAVALLTFGFSELKALFTHLKEDLTKKQSKTEDIVLQVSAVQNLLRKSHLDLIDENDFHPFLLESIKVSREHKNIFQAEAVLNYDIVEKKNEYTHRLKKIFTLSQHPIMVGLILGFFGVIPSLVNPGLELSLTDSLLIPLVSTLYGLMLSYFLYRPIINRVEELYNKDLESRRIIARSMRANMEETISNKNSEQARKIGSRKPNLPDIPV